MATIAVARASAPTAAATTIEEPPPARGPARPSGNSTSGPASTSGHGNGDNHTASQAARPTNGSESGSPTSPSIAHHDARKDQAWIAPPASSSQPIGNAGCRLTTSHPSAQ